MDLEQFDRKLTVINYMEGGKRKRELKSLSIHLDKILSLPLFEKIYSHVLKDDLNSLKSLLFSNPDNITILFQVSFSMKDALKSYLISLEQKDKYFMILSGIIFFLTSILLVILLFRHLLLKKESIIQDNQREQSLALMEKERNLLAFEIHDDMTQKLAIIKRNLEEGISLNDERTILSIQFTRDLIDTAREYSSSLKTPDILYDFDASIEKLCTDFSIYSHMEVKVKKLGLKALNMSNDKSINLYRIIQEFLTNAHKHSFANTVTLSIIYTHPILKLRLKDDGRGFDMKNLNDKGLGMSSIKYRLELLNARYQFNSIINEGTELRCEIRISNE